MKGIGRWEAVRRSRGFWLLAAVLAALGSGCAGLSAPTATEAGERRPAVQRRVPEITSEDRARAQAFVVEALDALAVAHRDLTRSRAPADGIEALRIALERVRSAQDLLPPETVVISLRSGQPLRLESPRKPVRVPITALGADTLEHLRSSPLRDAGALRVDLDELERRLVRATAGAPERALAAVLLASSTAIAIEPVPSDQVVDRGGPETESDLTQGREAARVGG